MTTARRPAVFVDKDGTLIENVPYNVDPARLRFMPDAAEALAALRRAGFALVVVTNQSGIARGLFTPAALAALEHALRRQLRAAAGIELDDFVFCPHGPDAAGDPVCACRKPQPGMLMRAAAAHGLDLARSWIVGDTLDDIEAGHRAGCRGALFDSGGETVWRRSPLRVPDAHCRRWDEITATILASQAQASAPLAELR